MHSTLVIQSHNTPIQTSWLKACIASVERWCESNQFQYQFLGDALFDPLNLTILEKVKDQLVIATDLARLYALREGLKKFDRVVWLDTDFLIFAPDQFVLPAQSELKEGYMLGREVWVQQDKERPNKLKSYVKVHNAFLLFDRENSFLEFYLQHAERLLEQCDGPMPPQFIGPKLLTALHNVIGCPVLESAGMLSPLVIDDLLSKGEQCCALNLMKKKSPMPMAGANLCRSLVAQGQRSSEDMESLVAKLLKNGTPL